MPRHASPWEGIGGINSEFIPPIPSAQCEFNIENTDLADGLEVCVFPLPPPTTTTHNPPPSITNHPHPPPPGFPEASPKPPQGFPEASLGLPGHASPWEGIGGINSEFIPPIPSAQCEFNIESTDLADGLEVCVFPPPTTTTHHPPPPITHTHLLQASPKLPPGLLKVSLQLPWGPPTTFSMVTFACCGAPLRLLWGPPSPAMGSPLACCGAPPDLV